MSRILCALTLSYSQALTYIMIMYNVLQSTSAGPRYLQKRSTYLTAGATVAGEATEKPALRTAVACKSPTATRTPTGMDVIAGFPRSSIRKKNQIEPLLKDVLGFVNEINNKDVLQNEQNRG